MEEWNIVADNIRIGFFNSREEAQKGLKYAKKGVIVNGKDYNPA